MEIRCPSCGAQHRSEDYPGAFDILCGCGYLILNPDIGGAPEDYRDINFEGPPVAGDHTVIPVDLNPPPVSDPDLRPIDSSAKFTVEDLTSPEDLPSGMLYDPTEVPGEITRIQAVPRTDTSELLVERIQKASMGQILGPDYDLEITGLEAEAKKKTKNRVEKFLQDHKWLREILERRSFIVENILEDEKLSRVPEPLAVEIYTATLENGGQCLFKRSVTQT